MPTHGLLVTSSKTVDAAVPNMFKISEHFSSRHAISEPAFRCSIPQLNSQQNRLFGDTITGESGETDGGGEEGRNGKVAVAAVTMADRVHTFIDADETGGTANHKE